MRFMAQAAWAACLALLIGSAAHAQPITPEDTKKAFDEARQAATVGPAAVPLAGQAVLKLPEGQAFVPQPQATRLLNAMGNPGQDTKLLGLVFPQGGQQGWFATVRFEDAGYIKDDDARDWNADDLLKSYREGTEAGNAERQKMGVPALEILGWAEKPAYEAATHRLVWAMSSREKGAPASEPQGVNYNTYVLGREGYFSLNLVTGLDELPAHKGAAHTLLAALQFDDGKRYADFKPDTDRVAEYGLAALVVGVAAKKLGFIALAGVFFAKFAKVIVLVLALVGAAAARIFKRRKAAAGDNAAPPAA
jgi:uncharacterized membrane-anchored protein